jgi:hypothetical protein
MLVPVADVVALKSRQKPSVYGSALIYAMPHPDGRRVLRPILALKADRPGLGP